MRKPHLSAALAATIAFASPLLAEAAEPVTLNFFHASASTANFLRPVVAKFMAAHPDIKINMMVPATNYSEAHQAVLRDIAADTLPDVYLASYSSLGSLVSALKDNGKAVALDPLMKGEGEGWVAANYGEALLKLGQYEGTQYGIPFNASTPILYVNEDLVTKAGGSMQAFPDSWDGVADLAAKITAADPSAAGLNFSVGGLSDDWYWQMMVMSVGAPMLNAEQTAIGYNDAKGLKALEMTQNMAVKSNMTVDTTPEPSQQQFFAGKLGMVVGSPSDLSDFTKAIGGRFHLRTAKFPMADKEHGGLPTGGNALTILAQDPATQTAAWTFVKYMTGPEAQAEISEATGYMPTNKNSAATLSDFYAANPNYRTVFEQMSYAAPWFSYPRDTGADIWKTQSALLDKLQRGQVTPKDALAEMAADAERVLKAQ